MHVRFNLCATSRRRGIDIIRVVNRARLQVIDHLLGDIHGDTILSFLSRGSQVRCTEHGGMLNERQLIVAWRFILEHIKGGTHYGARLDSLIERGFVDDAAAGTVDYTHAALHQGKFVTANEVCSSTGLGRMDGDEITGGSNSESSRALPPCSGLRSLDTKGS